MESRVALLERRIAGAGFAAEEQAGGAGLAERLHALAARVAHVESERPALAAARLKTQEQQLRVAALATDAEVLMLQTRRLQELNAQCEEVKKLAASPGVVDQDALVPDAILAREVATAKLVARRSEVSEQVRALVHDYALWIDSVNATLLAASSSSSSSAAAAAEAQS